MSLDQRNSLIGVTRRLKEFSEVLGTATGTASTSIPNGTKHSIAGRVFQVADGPYTIGGGGTVSGVKLVAEVAGPVDMALEPYLSEDWVIVDAVSGYDSFAEDSQPVIGRFTETDAEYRERAEVERYRRGQGPLLAIDAAVSEVRGVTYVRAAHNVLFDPVDSDDIPLHAINVVVKGGNDTEVAEAIFSAGPAGHQFFGRNEVGDTFVSVTVGTAPASEIVAYNRVVDTPIFLNVTLTTSTSEEDAPDDLSDLAKTTLVDYALGALDSNGVRQGGAWQIGSDVISSRLEAQLAGIAGVDAVLVEMSTPLVGPPWSTAKIPISIRNQAIMPTDGSNITVSEN